MSPRIFIIDDEPPIRELLQSYFQKHDFIVSTSGTASDALGKLGKEKFDIVILDVVLADADGLEVLAEIKAAHPDLPVIVMTGIGMDESLLRDAKLKGAAGYVSKTLPLDKLLKEVQGALQQF